MTVADLKKYKDSCYSSLSRDITEFEKNFLFLSGGLLAFSITFIKDIVHVKEAVWIVLLFLAWGLIISSIALMMYSFLKSANSSDLLWLTVDKFLLENTLHDETVALNHEQWKLIKGQVDSIFHNSKKILKQTRSWAVNVFLIGIVSLSLFISLNLVNEKINVKNDENLKSLKFSNESFDVILTDSAFIIKTKKK